MRFYCFVPNHWPSVIPLIFLIKNTNFIYSSSFFILKGFYSSYNSAMILHSSSTSWSWFYFLFFYHYFIWKTCKNLYNFFRLSFLSIHKCNVIFYFLFGLNFSLYSFSNTFLCSSILKMMWCALVLKLIWFWKK